MSLLEALLLFCVFSLLAYLVVKVSSLTKKVEEHVSYFDASPSGISQASWEMCGHGCNLLLWRGDLVEIALELGEEGREDVSCCYNLDRGTADFVTDSGVVIARLMIVEVTTDETLAVFLWSDLPEQSKDIFARHIPLPFTHKNFSF